MCGIVGVAGNLMGNDVKVFKDLLYMDTLRGRDSTGVLAINNALTEHKIVKNLGPAEYLMDRKAFQDVVTLQARVLLGHNRAGTMGQTSLNNAHPFEFDTVIGVHNGTIPYLEKNTMYEGKDFGTDSEAIYSNINQLGIEDTIGKMYDGAYCLVWYDRVAKSLCMIRNNQRPMFYAYNEDHTCIFWASEAYMLHAALERNGIKYKRTDVYMLPENTMMEWDVPLNNDKWPEAIRLDLKVPTKKTFEVYVPNARFQGAQQESKASTPPKTGGVTRDPTKEEVRIWGLIDPAQLFIDDDDSNGWHSNETIIEWFKRTGKDVENTVNDTPDVSNVIALDFKGAKTYRNPKTREEMTEDEFRALTHTGCDWCNKDLEYGDEVLFKEDTSGVIEAFCKDCVDQPDLNFYLNLGANK